MRILFLALLQALVFFPLAGLAEDGVMTSPDKNPERHGTTEARRAEVMGAYARLPLYFIRNDGQTDSRVTFYERGAGHATFFTKDGLVISLRRSEARRRGPGHGADTAANHENGKRVAEAVALSFVGADKGGAKMTASAPMKGRVNYFIGNDRSKWRRDIPTFGVVTYRDVYKNIDIKFYGNSRSLEHDVIVRPGGDVSRVVFAYRGIEGLKVTETGDLEVSLKRGRIIEQKPVIYQEIDGRRVPVEGAYKLLGQKDGAYVYGFDVASYDRAKDLVIDPVLVYSTYLGGSSGDQGNAIAVDRLGAVYVAGKTDSVDFPLVNPIQGVNIGQDVFVTKINPSGTAIVYSTFLGGHEEAYPCCGFRDTAFGIAVDATGAAYVTGRTSSRDFPLKYPMQGVYGGGSSDAFITKLNPAGSALLYSTYLGGTGYDAAFGIALDSVENAYVTGHTESSNFPLVLPMQPNYGGGSADAFVSEIDFVGSGLVYSTYLGGSSYDRGMDIAVDLAGSAYVTGETSSADFPTMRPIQAGFAGGWGGDSFITKFSPGGGALDYSTYLGGNGPEQHQGIAIDGNGAAYVTGSTGSADFPLVSPIQGVFAGGGADAYVAKVSPGGSAFVFSTYLGGGSGDFGAAIALDSSGGLYLTGWTGSTDFPLLNPMQGINNGVEDAFVTKMDTAGTAIAYSTYLGGSGLDNGRDIDVDGSGNAYVTGNTQSFDFPVNNPIQGVYGGLGDGFITALGGGSPPPPPPAITLALTPDAASVARGGTLGYSVKVTNTTATRQCFNYWETVTLPDGSTYPPTGTIFGPVRRCLPGGVSKTVHQVHGVPMSAPVGGYVFNAYTGAYPAAVVSEAHFSFDVTALGPLTPRPETTWRLIGKGFGGQKN